VHGLLHALVLPVAAALLVACSGPGGALDRAAAPELVLRGPVVLLGEVHDNAAQHRLRLAAFERWLAGGARPALVLEQFDRERQAEIDALRARTPPPDADALIAAVGARGWDWALYRPYIALALQHDLPIVAANVSREQARKVMREGLAAHGFEPAVPPGLLARLGREIEASHCGALDTTMAERMALGQVARDQAMARAVEAQAQAGRAVLLLAGNGHVRVDAGAPRWLSAATRARSVAIGVLETEPGQPPDAAELAQFDRVVTTPVQQRGDPCSGMKRPG
jgi:uncharacterized iron-regulated protein